jgi:quercetin dioxygenase-like cupin family protein
MSEQVVVRGPREGRTYLVGGGDYVTFKATGAETGGAYFCFEVTTTPGFSPPLHKHDYRELFYVLEGSFEFTLKRGDEVETITGTPGTAVSIPANVPHTFKNSSDQPSRMLFVHQPAALQDFFEEVGVPVSAPGEVPADLAPPDPAAFGAALARNGVQVIA